MIFIPSRGRPLSIRRFASFYIMSHATEPVCVFVDEDDAFRYQDIVLPATFKLIVHGPRKGIAKIMNQGLEQFPNEPYYGVLADDVVPRTTYWDREMKNACMPHYLAWADDGLQGENLPTHPFIGGDLVRALGWISCPDLSHWFVDNLWKEIAVALGVARYVPQVKLEHMHPFAGKAKTDQTYQQQPSNLGDQQAYQAYHQSGKFDALVKQVKEKLKL